MPCRAWCASWGRSDAQMACSTIDCQSCRACMPAQPHAPPSPPGLPSPLTPPLYPPRAPRAARPPPWPARPPPFLCARWCSGLTCNSRFCAGCTEQRGCTKHKSRQPLQKAVPFAIAPPLVPTAPYAGPCRSFCRTSRSCHLSACSGCQLCEHAPPAPKQQALSTFDTLAPRLHNLLNFSFNESMPSEEKGSGEEADGIEADDEASSGLTQDIPSWGGTDSASDTTESNSDFTDSSRLTTVNNSQVSDPSHLGVARNTNISDSSQAERTKYSPDASRSEVSPPAHSKPSEVASTNASSASQSLRTSRAPSLPISPFSALLRADGPMLHAPTSTPPLHPNLPPPPHSSISLSLAAEQLNSSPERSPPLSLLPKSLLSSRSSGSPASAKFDDNRSPPQRMAPNNPSILPPPFTPQNFRSMPPSPFPTLSSSSMSPAPFSTVSTRLTHLSAHQPPPRPSPLGSASPLASTLESSGTGTVLITSSPYVEIRGWVFSTLSNADSLSLDAVVAVFCICLIALLLGKRCLRSASDGQASHAIARRGLQPISTLEDYIIATDHSDEPANGRSKHAGDVNEHRPVV